MATTMPDEPPVPSTRFPAKSIIIYPLCSVRYILTRIVANGCQWIYVVIDAEKESELVGVRCPSTS
jgi:hypothetical protein